MENNSLDEEYRRFLRRGDEERERLRAKREAHKPELPAPQWPIGKPRITLWEAARLLAIVCPPALFAKSSDSGVRSAAIKGVTCGDLVQEILRWAREGRVHLIHPTLVLPMPRHPDPDEDWRIEPRMFEHIKNALANAHEPAVLPEPAVNDSRPLCSEKRMRFVEWGEAEQKQSGSYPPMQPNKRGRDDVRTWAARSGVSRKDAEEWAREAGWARKRGQRICK